MYCQPVNSFTGPDLLVSSSSKTTASTSTLILAAAFATVFLLTALMGVWAAYDRSLAARAFGLIVLGLVLAVAVVWIGRRGGARALGLMSVAIALLAGAIGVYFLLSYDWTAGAGKFALLQRIGLWVQTQRPAIALPEDINANVAASGLLCTLFLGLGGLLWAIKERLGLLLLVAVPAWLAGLAALILTVLARRLAGRGRRTIGNGLSAVAPPSGQATHLAPGARSVGRCGNSVNRGRLLGYRALTRRRAGVGRRARGRQRRQPGNAVARWIGPGGRLPVHRQRTTQHHDGLLHLWSAASRGLYLPHAQPLAADRRRAGRGGQSGLCGPLGRGGGQRTGRHAARPAHLAFWSVRGRRAGRPRRARHSGCRRIREPDAARAFSADRLCPGVRSGRAYCRLKPNRLALGDRASLRR